MDLRLRLCDLQIFPAAIFPVTYVAMVTREIPRNTTRLARFRSLLFPTSPKTSNRQSHDRSDGGNDSEKV